ncbi:MAG: WbuC family cupin fold metalloprotein [Muribaculaceae bacterium]|nr:WbuC family cupin fold metalloprotein [Muribaculaceae bacterium]
MTIDNHILDNLSAEARLSPRLRMNLDMRNSVSDKSQRMLNALEPGTELPIHRHRATSETCIILRGAAEEYLYDDNGRLLEKIIMKPGSECCGIDIPAGAWHKIVALEPNTVIFEAKDGAYEPLSEEDILK